ncbi:antitoxin VapB [Paucibacter oligotrophus]|uniref:Antitoxin VapB n=1 Tax=Roseateles oligotrophus TaxID=1769250 RepID=A0A840L6V1_9BURK|nr:AbrB/MazE/SpoVT family DNA-binding domain-containing protein [Roseateles oligotrophus]MBB4841948.1 antitoxin VapB [Roseateles oligotrophus]
MPVARENATVYWPEGGERHVRLFRNGANQAVRIPKEFELPGNEALMRREGDRLIIEAIKPKFEPGAPAALLALLEQWAAEGPIEEPIPDIDAGLLPLDDIVLGEPET